MHRPPPPTPKAPVIASLLTHVSDFSAYDPRRTLSRKAIRPLQTAFLLAHGVLPISRLCPETKLIDGPITDVCDTYAWAQTKLQAVVKTRGILVDEKRIVVIGWSTGGHLAMTTAWKSKEAGLTPPVTILSFYGPTDFESGGESAAVSGIPFHSILFQEWSTVVIFVCFFFFQLNGKQLT